MGRAVAALGAVALAGTAEAQMTPQMNVPHMQGQMPPGQMHGMMHGSKTVTMNKIDANGVGEAIGTITMRDTRQGLFIEPKLTGLPPGPHGFHIHQNPNCGPGPGANNQPAAGMAAGGHYDPKSAGKHRGPHADDSHLGDLPVLVVETNGTASLPVVAKRLKLSDVTNRSIMIHAGGDNFDDTPAPLGGGGGRIACGLIK
jgi:Cu-Zn family superoxide dismutase